MSRPELARLSGIKYPTLAGIENGDQASSTKLHKLAEALQCTPEYLETGRHALIHRDAKPRGPAPAMPPVTADELNLLTVYRTADTEAKEVIREQAEQIAKLSKKRRRRRD